MGAKGAAVEYLSIGANRQTAVADWAADGTLAFGADINVALWKPSAESSVGVSKLLAGHKEHVKAIAFLPQAEGDPSSYLITGSDDKTLVVWKSAAGNQNFDTLSLSSQHAAPINCITALRIQGPSPKWLLATGSADATIKIWNFEDDRLELLQSVKTAPKFFPLSLALSYVDDDADALALAAAGTRDTVQILTAETKTDARQFTLQATLAGHEGWIRSLSFAKESQNPGSDLLLASASQDKYIRIWRLHKGKDMPPSAAAGSDPTRDAFLPGKSPSNKVHRLRAAGKDYSAMFEALLLGHEDWVYSAKWHQHASGKLQLLSTSADNSLAIWEADPGSGIWVSMVRLGEISREKGATTATGSTGGFWTGLWSPDGRSVACLGRTGSWRRWEYDSAEDTWRPCVTVTGHTKAVTGVAWSKDGDFLLSSSADQTTRLHTRWMASGAGTWHEMSRPQIHGYDLNCVDSLGSSQFVSGADEKLMRVFSEPKAVASMLHRLAGIGEADVSHMPDAANMPLLGLSNKAIDAVSEDEEIQPVDDRDREALDPATAVKRSYLDIAHPPLEETLSRHTLWPEAEKLYGHGYELSCLAASHDGALVASACKASSANHAVIRLFETLHWTEVRPPLAAHALTATRLRFSADDVLLLSVGRDRQWAVFERGAGDDKHGYRLLQAEPKGHSRMILDATWLPSETPAFATAGRDKQVRIWSARRGEDGGLRFAQATALPCAAPATAVDALGCLDRGKCVLAVGLESGRLSLCMVTPDGSGVEEIPPSPELCLPKAVLQLAWRPTGRDGRHQLAVAGEDSSLRLYAFDETYMEAASP